MEPKPQRPAWAPSSSKTIMEAFLASNPHLPDIDPDSISAMRVYSKDRTTKVINVCIGKKDGKPMFAILDTNQDFKSEDMSFRWQIRDYKSGIEGYFKEEVDEKRVLENISGFVSPFCMVGELAELKTLIMFYVLKHERFGKIFAVDNGFLYRINKVEEKIRDSIAATPSTTSQSEVIGQFCNSSTLRSPSRSSPSGIENKVLRSGETALSNAKQQAKEDCTSHRSLSGRDDTTKLAGKHPSQMHELAMIQTPQGKDSNKHSGSQRSSSGGGSRASLQEMSAGSLNSRQNARSPKIKRYRKRLNSDADKENKSSRKRTSRVINVSSDEPVSPTPNPTDGSGVSILAKSLAGSSVELEDSSRSHSRSSDRFEPHTSEDGEDLPQGSGNHAIPTAETYSLREEVEEALEKIEDQVKVNALSFLAHNQIETVEIEDHQAEPQENAFEVPFKIFFGYSRRLGEPSVWLRMTYADPSLPEILFNIGDTEQGVSLNLDPANILKTTKNLAPQFQDLAASDKIKAVAKYYFLKGIVQKGINSTRQIPHMREISRSFIEALQAACDDQETRSKAVQSHLRPGIARPTGKKNTIPERRRELRQRSQTVSDHTFSPLFPDFEPHIQQKNTIPLTTQNTGDNTEMDENTSPSPSMSQFRHGDARMESVLSSDSILIATPATVTSVIHGYSDSSSYFNTEQEMQDNDRVEEFVRRHDEITRRSADNKQKRMEIEVCDEELTKRLQELDLREQHLKEDREVLKQCESENLARKEYYKQTKDNLRQEQRDLMRDAKANLDEDSLWDFTAKLKGHTG